MKRKAFVVSLVACLLLPSCGGNDSGGNDSGAPYKVTVYSGGVVVREWDGVSGYTWWGDEFIEIRVDGESFCINGGTVTIEPDEERQ